MKIDRADVFYNYRLNDEEKYQEFQENEIDYKRAVEVFDKFPWENELKLLEIQDSSGGISFSKGIYSKDNYLSFLILCDEHHKVTIMASVVLKKGFFFGLIGSKSIDKDYTNISHTQAKEILKSIFTKDIETLYDQFSS